MNCIKDIVEYPNSQSAVARQLAVTPQAVQKWVAQGYVPVERAIELERLYGVPAINLVSPKKAELVLKISESNA